MGFILPQMICYVYIFGRHVASVSTLGFGISHLEVAQVFPIAASIVDFGLGSRGM